MSQPSKSDDQPPQGDGDIRESAARESAARESAALESTALESTALESTARNSDVHKRSQGLLADLDRRGLIHDSTDRAALLDRLAEGPITVYVGFDPTAASLHAGNLLPLLMLTRFQDAGHRPIVLAGGATGMVGDPSGRSDERQLLDDEALAVHLAGIVPQLRQFLDFDQVELPAKLLDNRAWTVGVGYLEFLRDVGKYVTVNQMAAKDSVRSRMDSDQGISYTEFSYMLLQGHDFQWLYENEGCEMQMGGSDQWGNIVLGLDLIRRKTGGSGHALTVPLLTKPDGSKYGKTASGDTLWLDALLMSPYRFYQAWIQSDDDEVRKLLLQLTFVDVAEVEELCDAHAEAPHQRLAQRRLAWELTALVHSEEAAVAAERASGVIFGGKVAALDRAALAMLAGEIPSSVVDRACLGESDNLLPLLRKIELISSNSEGHRLLKQQGISINDVKVPPGTTLRDDDLLHERWLMVRKGKKQMHLVDFGEIT